MSHHGGRGGCLLEAPIEDKVRFELFKTGVETFHTCSLEDLNDLLNVTFWKRLFSVVADRNYSFTVIASNSFITAVISSPVL